MALRVTTSLRMTAMMATFGFLPAASKRCLKAFKIGFHMAAAWAAMKRTRRTAARPPKMERNPFILPLSKSYGTTPTKAAIERLRKLPS